MFVNDSWQCAATQPTLHAPARLLFTVICVLFGIMNLGAAVGFLLDARERRAFFAALQHPAVGFRATEESVWIWKFSLEPLRGEIDAPTGAWSVFATAACRMNSAVLTRSSPAQAPPWR
jgi:hypothetical protein